MTLRPLFVDLNLILSKLSTRFSRSKSSSTSEASSSRNISEGVSHLQWPGTRSRQEDSAILSYERTDAKRGLRILTVDLETGVGKDGYTQL